MTKETRVIIGDSAFIKSYQPRPIEIPAGGDQQGSYQPTSAPTQNDNVAPSQQPPVKDD